MERSTTQSTSFWMICSFIVKLISRKNYNNPFSCALFTVKNIIEIFVKDFGNSDATLVYSENTVNNAGFVLKNISEHNTTKTESLLRQYLFSLLNTLIRSNKDLNPIGICLNFRLG